MSAWGNPRWHEHVQPLQRHSGARPPAPGQKALQRIVSGDSGAAEARGGEWTAPPPGRLGRRLLADIEPYLGFFAIARSD